MKHNLAKRSLLLLITGLALQAQAVDFKYVMPLELMAKANGFVFDVPEVVYQKVHYSDLRDVRVLNASNDSVPMRLSLNHDEVKRTLSATTLPVFSLNQTVNLPVTTKQVKTTWKGDIQSYTVSTSNSVQNFLQSQEVSRDDTVLIDASLVQHEQAVALELKWAFETPGNRVFYVELLGSNDLSQWRQVLSNQKMIELDTGAKTVLENKMPLSGQSFEYYQLRFKNQPVPQVLEVKAIMLSHAVSQQLQWTDVANFSVLDPNLHGHVLEWDMGGFYPVESIKIDFDYKNLMADIQLYSKHSEQANWKPVAKASVYAVGEGDMAMFNNQIDFKSNRHRYWRLSSQSEISSQWVDKLSFGWRQHRIQFLAQGEGPYGLHFGSDENQFNPDVKWFSRLSKAMKQSLFSDQVSLNAVQTPKVIPKELITKPETINYSRWLFWGLLLVVLSLLLVMATKLLKEVGDEESK